VDHDIAEIEDDPARRRDPLPAETLDLVFPKLVIDLFFDRPDLRLGLCAADHDVVNDVRDPADVQDLERFGLLAFRGCGDLFNELPIA